MPPYLSQLLAVLLPVGVQLVVFLRWLHRRLRDDEIHRAFVYDVATNHLPHIYDALRAIAEQQGIAQSEPPPLPFIDLNESRRKEHRSRRSPPPLTNFSPSPSVPFAIPPLESSWAAACCAKNWTPPKAKRRRVFFSGTAVPTRTIPLKSWRAVRVTFERPADSLCRILQCATGFISQSPQSPY